MTFIKNDIQHKRHSALMTVSRIALDIECCYILVMLNVIMLSVIKLSVVMLNVVAREQVSFDLFLKGVNYLPIRVFVSSRKEFWLLFAKLPKKFLRSFFGQVVPICT
jgi:hypothetical protein